ncbi:uncharacterized protein BJ171DRAFT_485467 [Polychytrium aggregatum]|uniref:uncharacterized protein n=1 Tax=Polychytrium aggregatum TaxID=110093 RepID=UPI0022FEF86F|nr:uncharacterized protein BJ171DRAFT_485467 [Polychytrium aggregatum]KAI9209892.1 hypothetical protein BJ171DRAFT_485467 [Polychytrium aggregatum]
MSKKRPFRSPSPVSLPSDPATTPRTDADDDIIMGGDGAGLDESVYPSGWSPHYPPGATLTPGPFEDRFKRMRMSSPSQASSLLETIYRIPNPSTSMAPDHRSNSIAKFSINTRADNLHHPIMSQPMPSHYADTADEQQHQYVAAGASDQLLHTSGLVGAAGSLYSNINSQLALLHAARTPRMERRNHDLQEASSSFTPTSEEEERLAVRQNYRHINELLFKYHEGSHHRRQPTENR